MSRSWKRINRILAFILAGVIMFSNDSILTAFATEDTVFVVDGEAGDDSQSQDTAPTTGDSNPTQNTDTTAVESSQTQNTDTTTVESSQSENTEPTVSANVPGEGETIPDCLEGKTHEYEEIKAEDGTVTGYGCVFCQRQIDAETYTNESGTLHAHSWTRPEGLLIPVCDTCGAERRDCEAEDGYGVHVFELVQEEGQADKYICISCGLEKDALEEWDLTQEMFMQIMGLTPLGYTFDGMESSLPTTIAELREAEAGGFYGNKIFNVESLADLAALQLLSNDGFEFEGYTVNFVARRYADGVGGDNTNWDLTGMSRDVFSGLGTEEHPFKGTLTSYYTGGSLRFTTAIPLLNYVATGAKVSELQVNAAISGNGSSPVGIIAAHVVAGTAGDTVSLANLSLSGTVNNNGGAAGILFGEVVNTGTTPIKLCYEQSDIALQASVTAANAGGITGQTTGKVEVHQGTVFTSGNINGSVSAGMLVGTINSEGSLYIGGTGDTTVTANVGGNGVNGGFVGIMNQGEILRADGKTATVTIGGSVGGSIAGGLVGQLNHTSFTLERITMNAGVSAGSGSKVAAGGIIGQYMGEAQGTADSTKWDQINDITVNGNVSSGSSTGGIIGLAQGSNLRIGAADTTDAITIKGNISGTNAAGGVVGTAEGQYIEVYNAVVSNTLSTASAIGGIIGAVGNGTERTVVLVNGAKVSSTMKPSANNKFQGCILGDVYSNSMAAINGTIDVSGAQYSTSYSTDYWGHIAGRQTEALVYFEEACAYTRPADKRWVDDIGSYGGVYRNGSWGESGALISYADKDITGTVTNNGSQWVLDTEADMMRLAIMLNSQGKFAANCFSGTDKASLLTAEYSLCPADGSFDLEESGIYALNRNDRVGRNECFEGKLIGAGGSRISIKLEDAEERVSRQSYVSLFPYAGNGAVFENLQVVRNLRGVRTAAAGLAAYGVNDTTVRNVDIEMKLTGSAYSLKYYYGGMFADYTAAAGTTLTVENSRIGGTIKISQSNPNGDGQRQNAGGMISEYRSTTAGSNLPVIKINGLELAGTVSSTSRLASGMITHINGYNSSQDKVILAMNNIHIKDGAKVIITDDLETGGLLGRMWYDVAPYKDEAAGEFYSFKNLTVGDDTTAGEGPYLESRGWFGGMVHTVTGRIQLKDTKIQNGTFYGSNSATGFNGLLFRDGYLALVELEGYEIAGIDVGVKDIDYTAINSKVAITGTTPNFSDIVGRNISNINYYTSGGIVNIISEEFDDNMVAYSNHLLHAGQGSSYSRYYYNLFGTSLAGEDTFLAGRELDASNMVITDADQMMIWHLTQYMNASIRRYLAPYYKDGTKAVVDSAVNKPVSIKGTIDLKSKSYYPTPVSGGVTISGLENAEILFHGDKVTDGTTKPPALVKENYMMHAGLLISHTGNVTVHGDDDYLTLSGKVSNLGESSGALFVRTITGTKNIYKIRLKDLYINNYAEAYHGNGLLVGNIGDGSQVQISWIETDYTSPTTKAASSLIGQVGNNNATQLRLDFTNIKVDDKADGIFKYSTLIDKNFYTDTTEKNQGRVRYLFTEEAYRGTDGTSTQKDPFAGSSFHGNNDYSSGAYVTIGKELKEGVEYWNVDGLADFLTNNEITDWDSYLPYVCTSHDLQKGKDIEVNPKNAAITEGCGTYEDPYQITSAKQLLALSRYLINKDDSQYLEGWKIRKTGAITDTDSDGICDKTHVDTDLKTYGDADFPTQDELRTAYYVITKDIDFTTLPNVTDRNIAQEYVGLGTDDMPFAGVIVGQKDNISGSCPTIILPHKKVNNSCANFGFIQYAKGAVVKDLIITSKETTDTDLTDVVRVSSHAGSVIACILGGDNIIDNVTVSNRISVEGYTSSGGYVGTLRQGSLILRNMDESKLSGYQCGRLNSDNKTMTELSAAQLKSYPHVSGVIGKVENGFVIYEDGSAPVGSVVLAHEATSISGVYSHSVLPLSKTYDIITESGMSGNKIAITSEGTDFKAKIENAAQLQLVSMAINSDAFSVYYNQGGYDKQTVCRKADYDEIGNVTATPEYELATKKDDGVYWYPYIYQYFTFDTVEAAASDKASGSGFYATLESYTADDGETGYRSKLNAVTSDITAAMTYELAHDASKDKSEIDYDLSVYRRGFRGLGATYRIFTSDATSASLTVREDQPNTNANRDLLHNRALADFRANFNGNGATVKAEMINDYEGEIHTTALFNDLVNTTASNDYYIKNLVVTGRFTTYTNYKSNYASDRAAALVGMMRKPWEITNIEALDVTVESMGHAAGIVAWINPVNIAGKKVYTFEECKVSSEHDSDGDGKATNIRTVGGSSGGIIGVMSPVVLSAHIYDYELKLINCQVRGTKDASGQILYVGIENDGDRSGLHDQYYEDIARGRCGGFIGHVGRRDGSNEIGIKLAIEDTLSQAYDIQYVAISGGDSTGGVLGEYYGYRKDSETDYKNVKIDDITVADSKVEAKNKMRVEPHKLFGVGGIIGKVQKEATCQINNSNVTNTDVRSLRTKDTGTVLDLHAGGVIGFCYYNSKIYLNKVQVTGTLDASGNPQHQISSKYNGVGGLIASFSYGNTDKCYVEVRDCLISGMKITVDNRTEDSIANDIANGSSTASVGGMFGYVTNTDIAVDSSIVKDCTIQSGTGAVGGVIGGAKNSSVNTNLSNIVVDSCIIGNNGYLSGILANSGTGGVFGIVAPGVSVCTQKLKNITVKNSYLYGKWTGGIAGNITANQQIGNVWSDGNDYEIKIENNCLLGYWAGGVIGWNNESGKLCFKKVTIDGNTIVALRNTDNYSAAGGFIGSGSYRNHTNLNDITIKKNHILSGNPNGKNGAGGMFGNLHLIDKVYTYGAVVEDNAIGYYDVADDSAQVNNLLSSNTLTNQIQTMKATLNEAKTKAAKLKNSSTGTYVDSMPASMEEADIANYACYFGNLVGVYVGSGHAYFLAPTVTYTNAYTGVRPVVDVGSTSSGSAGSQQLMSYPYAYRKNIHVVYHEPDTTATNTAVEPWGVTDEDKQRLFSMVNVEQVLKNYKEAVESQETSKLLDAYRLNVQDDSGNTVTDIYEKIYNDATNSYLSPLKVTSGGDKKPLPMIVIDTQYGTTDQLMTSVIAALTGVGGVHNSGTTNRNDEYDTGINQIMGISVQPMKVENGVISKDTSGREASIKYSTNRIEISDNGYDAVEEDGDGTFSLLTITYKQKDYAAIDKTTNTISGETVTLQIPVFVMERLTIDTHLKIAEGEVYNADTAKEKGLCTAPLLANNSSYTLYAEYIYGEARNKYSTDSNPVCINKTIGMTYKDENGNICKTDFWKGTRLTLIDVCDSDKVYYYTVTGEEGRPIEYTDFKDANGNAYKNKPIHGTQGMEIYSGTDTFSTKDAEKIDNNYVDKTFEYQNVAVERFLIVADTTQVDESLKNITSDIRDYEITPQLSDSIMKRTTLTEHTDLQITRQPGLTIGLIPPGQENEPKIDGMIETEGKVTVDATFQIEGDSQYWARVLTSQTTTIDSANHYKYMEVGIYLTDKNGNRVKLPDNTNITINGKQLQPWEEVTKPETNLGAYVNQSTAYFYKDGRITFPLDALKDMIQREMDENSGRTKGFVRQNCKFELNFSNANLTEYTENEYEVHLELLRIEDAEYPAGGELIDSYVGTVPAARKIDLACALETEDLMELGINIYNQQTTMPHTINFDFKLDFNGVISNNQTMNQQIANKYYTVTYRILEKTNRNGTPQYEPYTGDQLSLALVDPPAGEQQELIKGASSTGTENNSVYVTYHFDWNEIKNGTDKKAKGVITRDLKLTVADAEQMDLSNYKIQASVMVSDDAPGDIDQVVNKSLTDFFIFTVAKLKTDLDY